MYQSGFDHMIIDCGKRRLKSYRYGWVIQIQRRNKETGEVMWVDDAPAFPSTLARACEALVERALIDGPDLTIDELPNALKSAAQQVREWFAKARAAA